nr:MAG TPA: hypothetical protein [Caudoviricetes sp.]
MALLVSSALLASFSCFLSSFSLSLPSALYAFNAVESFAKADANNLRASFSACTLACKRIASDFCIKDT